MSNAPHWLTAKGVLSEGAFWSLVSAKTIAATRHLSVEEGRVGPARSFEGLFQRSAQQRKNWRTPVRLSGVITFRGSGHLGTVLDIYIKWRKGLRMIRRLTLQLPARGQRSRSNAKTIRRVCDGNYNFWLWRSRARRVSAGSVYGANVKRKKTLAKLQPKKSPVKASVKKGPVRRSKDFKKSVWA